MAGSEEKERGTDRCWLLNLVLVLGGGDEEGRKEGRGYSDSYLGKSRNTDREIPALPRRFKAQSARLRIIEK